MISIETAISVRHISKMYPLYNNPRDRLRQSLWHALPSFLQSKSRTFYREFWALHNISFNVRRGETIGIIGHNGSGKSTLLQIIAGTLTPTVGEVHLNGRVAALLELGSGFNPEFTGRENIELNGSILGLSQTEMAAITSDIIAFADIGPFIDQPVKHYSSGMFVRLAFAVQTFVPKDIFVVDEALAVGDQAFQRKCMVSLEKFRQIGGTVLLVSHNLQTIVRQCERCLILGHGKLLVEGESKPVTDLYQRIMHSKPPVVERILADLQQHGLQYALTQTNESRSYSVTQATVRALTTTTANINDWFDINMPSTEEIIYGNGHAEIKEYGMYDVYGRQVNVLVTGRRYHWIYRVQFHQEAHNVQFGMMLKTVDGLEVAGVSSKRELVYFEYVPAETAVQVTFDIQLNVVPGTYFMNSGVDGLVDDTITYLHRRVDLCMIRVLSHDTRQSYGIADLAPRFTYELQPTSGQQHV